MDDRRSVCDPAKKLSHFANPTVRTLSSMMRKKDREYTSFLLKILAIL